MQNLLCLFATATLIVLCSPYTVVCQNTPTNSSKQSQNFVVKGQAVSSETLKSAEQQCEALRSELRRVWGVTDVETVWKPRCEIVLHSNLKSYTQAVGIEGASTKGCSSIDLDRGRVVSRRIDLVLESDGSIPALAHELTHVVVADRFKGHPVPHWFDEGIAMLADTREKQMLHERDCHEAIQFGSTLKLSKLLSLEGFDSPEQMPAFYGQSLYLVHMLAQRKEPKQLLQFATDSVEKGNDYALQKHYGIKNVKTLEDQWKAYVKEGKQSPSRLAIVMNDYTRN